MLNPIGKTSSLRCLWGHLPHNPGTFKRRARQLASARLRKSFNYVVVSPALPLTTVLADDHGHWLPIKPGTDSALAMAMIRWIIDNERYVAAYLKLTSREAMTRAGEKAGAMPPAGYYR